MQKLGMGVKNILHKNKLILLFFHELLQGFLYLVITVRMKGRKTMSNYGS